MIKQKMVKIWVVVCNNCGKEMKAFTKEQARAVLTGHLKTHERKKE